MRVTVADFDKWALVMKKRVNMVLLVVGLCTLFRLSFLLSDSSMIRVIERNTSTKVQMVRGLLEGECSRNRGWQ